jgi:hypothetical protein
VLLDISPENTVDPKDKPMRVSYPQEYDETKDWILVVQSPAQVANAILVFAIRTRAMERKTMP